MNSRQIRVVGVPGLFQQIVDKATLACQQIGLKALRHKNSQASMLSSHWCSWETWFLLYKQPELKGPVPYMRGMKLSK